MKSSIPAALMAAIFTANIAFLIHQVTYSNAQLHVSMLASNSSQSLFPDYSNLTDDASDNVSSGSNRSTSTSSSSAAIASPPSSLNDVDSFEVLKLSSSKAFNNGLNQQQQLLPPLEPLYGAPAHPPLINQQLGPIYGQPAPSFVHPPSYTRVKLGYGNFYYNGQAAELRCQFPPDLHTVSNYVWSKVTDNLVHFLDSYRIFERSYGHTSSLFIRDVMDKDFGVYSCAVSGSNGGYGVHTATFYQEVHFYPPQPHTYLNPAYGRR